MTTHETSGPRPAHEPSGRFTARSPADLVAFVPVALGFVPSESVTMLALGGPRPFHARVDLPDDVEDVDLLVETLLAPALKHKVERVAFVLHADDTSVANELGWSLAAAFAGEGIGVLEVLRVHGGRWYATLPGSPPEHYAGVPFDPAAHPFAAQSVVEGRVTLPSREALRDSLAPDVAGTAEVVEALATPGRRDAEPGEVQRVVRRRVAAAGRCDAAEVALLACALGEPGLRDEAWSLMERGEAAAHVELWSDVLRRTPADLAAGPAAVLAVAAWLAGNGALAWCAVDRCRELEPDHSLARLVAEVLQTATPPTVWDQVRASLDRAAGELPDAGVA